jgi:hypothetical protein
MCGHSPFVPRKTRLPLVLPSSEAGGRRLVVENTHTDLTDNLRPNSIAVMRGSSGEIGGAFQPAFDLVVFRPAEIHSKEQGLYGAGATVTSIARVIHQENNP